MQRRMVCGLLIAVLEGGVASAQGLTDQFELLRPELSVTEFQQGFTSFFEVTGGHGIDALGGFYQLAVRTAGAPPFGPHCLSDSTLGGQKVYEVVRRSDSGDEPILRVLKCVDLPTGNDYQVTDLLTVAADSINGFLYVGINFRVCDCSSCCPTGGYGIVRVSGLPTLLDIIATFQPADGTFSWVTPKHPMGLIAADRFQVFAGNLSDLPDWTRAEPVSCDLPGGGAPQPGQYVSIADPLPDPPVGEGRYVVIGVEHAGQRRFGRQNIDGVMSGRDPAAFPACE